MTDNLILDIKVTQEVYDVLVKEKFQGRYRNIDDVLRVKFGLPVIHRPVKQYSDETGAGPRLEDQ